MGGLTPDKHHYTIVAAHCAVDNNQEKKAMFFRILLPKG